MRKSFAILALVLVLAWSTPASAAGVPMVSICARPVDVEVGELVRAQAAGAEVVLTWYIGRPLARLLASLAAASSEPSVVLADRALAATRKADERLLLFREGCLAAWVDVPAGWSAGAAAEGL